MGRLDEQAVFYLQSRGVSEVEARRMMAHAFIAEVLERVANPDWRKHLKVAIDATLDAPKWLPTSAQSTHKAVAVRYFRQIGS